MAPYGRKRSYSRAFGGSSVGKRKRRRLAARRTVGRIYLRRYRGRYRRRTLRFPRRRRRTVTRNKRTSRRGYRFGARRTKNLQFSFTRREGQSQNLFYGGSTPDDFTVTTIRPFKFPKNTITVDQFAPALVSDCTNYERYALKWIKCEVFNLDYKETITYGAKDTAQSPLTTVNVETRSPKNFDGRYVWDYDNRFNAAGKRVEGDFNKLYKARNFRCGKMSPTFKYFHRFKHNPRGIYYMQPRTSNGDRINLLSYIGLAVNKEIPMDLIGRLMTGDLNNYEQDPVTLPTSEPNAQPQFHEARIIMSKQSHYVQQEFFHETSGTTQVYPTSGITSIRGHLEYDVKVTFGVKAKDPLVGDIN